MSKKIGVVLSGCGVYDGSEIHEAVLTLLAIDQNNAEALCIAPNIQTMHIIDHSSGAVTENETRNVLKESARIARGNIKDIKDISAKDFDALMFPGGFGAAKNLCDFAVKGADCDVNPDVERLIKETHKAKKPIAFVCIAPVIASKVLKNIDITIGNDKDVAEKLRSLGSNHINCSVENFVVDKENKIVSSPAYMLGQRITEVAKGIENTVDNLIKLC